MTTRDQGWLKCKWCNDIQMQTGKDLLCPQHQEEVDVARAAKNDPDAQFYAQRLKASEAVDRAWEKNRYGF